ncbi:hypothetical protein V6N13_045281 [Hibiscus sabdariffa]|uniref:Sushi domain-containing protein n=1 Tax=Hibiscus sabdariffa TaxID=183260 RepID=A0ABR2RL16_9ROSI
MLDHNYSWSVDKTKNKTPHVNHRAFNSETTDRREAVVLQEQRRCLGGMHCVAVSLDSRPQQHACTVEVGPGPHILANTCTDEFSRVGWLGALLECGPYTLGSPPAYKPVWN